MYTNNNHRQVLLTSSNQEEVMTEGKMEIGEERMYRTKVVKTGKIHTVVIKEAKCKYPGAKGDRDLGFCVCCQYTFGKNHYVCPFSGEEVKPDGPGLATSYCTYPI